MKLRLGFVWVACVATAMAAWGQTPVSSSPSISVPPIIQFSNVATDLSGYPLSGTVSITFSLYSNSQGGAALWSETQNVQLDTAGHYSVYLGLTQTNGLPANLFTGLEARWLGVKIAGQAEQPRIYLVSVPYAMKAGDAATVGGLPPSAFVLATPSGSATNTTSTDAPSSGSTQSSAPPPNGAITGAGTVDYIPLWDTTSDIISSVLYQSGTGTTAKIGINTKTPASALDIQGGATVRGTLSLPSAGAATSSAGKNSQAQTLAASAFNSSTSKPVNQLFQWQAEPAGNDTASPSGTLNLLFGSGTTKAAETGLHIASNGQINFAEGQTFPGTGTLTGVTTASGSGLTGGGTSGTLNLGLTTSCAANQVLQWNGSTWTCTTISGGGGTITGVTAGAGLSGGGTSGSVTLTNTGVLSVAAGTGVSVTAGQSPTISVNAAQVPLLSSANTFTNSQTVSGNLTATGVISGSSFQIGSNLFDYGSYSNLNAFLGFAGNTTTSGSTNTGSGWGSLANNTSGDANTAGGVESLLYNTVGTQNVASGFEALLSNTSGNYNTAAGTFSLYYNNGGNFNTALGYFAGSDYSSPNLTNSTAIGANADVTQSNSLVLGSINGVKGATASVNVGIGTTAPISVLEADVNAPRALGPTFTLTNTGGNPGAAASIDLNSYTPSKTGTYNPAARIEALDDNYSDDLLFLSNKPGATNQGLIENMRITSSGLVGIGTSSPDSLLSVNGSADKPGGGSWATFSDARLKNVDGDFTAGLDQVLKLRTIRYRYKEQNAMGIHDRDEHIGFVAQEVKKVIPEAVSQNQQGYLLVNNDPIILAMLNAIKQQQKEIAEQKQLIRHQIRVVSAQQHEISRLNRQVGALKVSLHDQPPSGHALIASKMQP